MKKLFTLVLAAMLLCSVCASLAEDTGIQMIGGPTSDDAADVVNLDDIRIGQVAHIEGFGDVEIMESEFYRWFSDFGVHEESKYLVIEVRILNTTKKSVNYYSMIGDIICNYADDYQFKGWARQKKSDTDNAYFYKNSSDSYDISTLYAGRYAICVTLPNIVRDSSEPLSVTFNIGENHFTYHVRK